MSNRLKVVAGTAALALTLAGCASTGETEFGSSVRHMVQGQTFDPAAPRPDMSPADGQKAAQAVDAYHADKKAAAKTGTATSILIPTTTQ